MCFIVIYFLESLVNVRVREKDLIFFLNLERSKKNIFMGIFKETEVVK